MRRLTRFAINIVSLMHLGWQLVRFPGCFFTKPQNLIDDALTMGYDGVQIIPIRGATGNETGILLWETAWNPVYSLAQALTHEYGDGGLPSCINDYIVSPDPIKCGMIGNRLHGRGLQQVCHHTEHVPEGCWVEVNPDNRLTAREYVTAMQQNKLGGFVIDTHHLRRPSRQGWPNALLTVDGSWIPAVDTLAPYVKTIHLHPNSLDEFLFNPPGSVEANIIRQLHQAGTNFGELIIVAEYAPTKNLLLSPTKSRSVAIRMLEEMHRLVT